MNNFRQNAELFRRTEKYATFSLFFRHFFTFVRVQNLMEFVPEPRQKQATPYKSETKVKQTRTNPYEPVQKVKKK